MVLTVSFALSPVTGLFVTVIGGSDFRQLDASVGASGPHDFAVRSRTVRRQATKTSTASRPTFVTMANAPLSGETGEAVEVICPSG